jgi:hypothetical protein
MKSRQVENQNCGAEGGYIKTKLTFKKKSVKK